MIMNNFLSYVSIRAVSPRLPSDNVRYEKVLKSVKRGDDTSLQCLKAVASTVTW